MVARVVSMLFVCFASISYAALSPSKAEHGLVGPSARFDNDLTAMLHRGPIHEPRVFEVAYKRIQDMESSPPCQQLATSTLIDACQSFNPMAEPGSRSTHDNRRSLDEQLEDCVESFYQVEQRWTSFSNAHSNAIVICQASRASVENLQHLETLKTAANTQADMSEALSQTLHEAQSRLEAQKVFVEAIEKFQRELVSRLQESSTRTELIFARLMEKADSAVEAFISTIHRGTQDSGQGLDELNNRIEESTVTAHDLETYLQEVHNRALERNHEYAVAQKSNMVSNKDIATELKNALESLRGDSVQELSESISAVDARVYGVLTTVMQAIQASQDNLEEVKTVVSIQNLSFGSISGILASWAGIALCIVLVSITWALGASNAVAGLHHVFQIATVLDHNVYVIAVSLAIASSVIMAFAGTYFAYTVVRRCMIYQDQEGILPKIEAPGAIPSHTRPENRPIWQVLGLSPSSRTTS
ncbi:hypothetical protein K490DRAFT_53421 [Saccharata proteae CBS 121410]|uniref:Nuclear fusion protein KAR5 n=1 Tax=Saccharata proteae CBS 121410 TaxID=1314787 RepID=A0A9P4I2A7_9PEZI|nr:hypothetical protein K490DRAFT_53421 [Saccharata proteae CBS 121410]